MFYFSSNYPIKNNADNNDYPETKKKYRNCKYCNRLNKKRTTDTLMGLFTIHSIINYLYFFLNKVHTT